MGFYEENKKPTTTTQKKTTTVFVKAERKCAMSGLLLACLCFKKLVWSPEQPELDVLTNLLRTVVCFKRLVCECNVSGCKTDM